jgi:MoaA/NifB/PqqE/SkfB family radical SAM enzyme
MEAISILHRENVPYGINWVARHDNTPDFGSLLALCRKYNALYLSVVANKLTGNNEMGSPLSQEDLEEIAKQIDNNKETHIQIEFCFPMLLTHIKTLRGGFGMQCNAGVSNCNINCDMTFQPCTHLKVPEYFATLEDYWHSSSTLKILRDNPANNLEPCRRCIHKKACCLCRAMSPLTNSNFVANSQSCINYSNIMTGV